MTVVTETTTEVTEPSLHLESAETLEFVFVASAKQDVAMNEAGLVADYAGGWRYPKGTAKARYTINATKVGTYSLALGKVVKSNESMRRSANACIKALVDGFAEAVDKMEQRNASMVRAAQYEVAQSRRTFEWHVEYAARNGDRVQADAFHGATKSAARYSYSFAGVEVSAFAKIAKEGDVAKYGDTFAVEVGQPLVGWEIDGEPFRDPEVLYVTFLEAKGAANTKLCEKVLAYRDNEIEQGESMMRALIAAGFDPFAACEKGGENN